MHHHDHEPCSPSCPECAFGPFTRNHYFTGKLLVERDFTDEQRYHIDKLRHHNAVLHGHGIVCGLQVTPHENPACRDRFVCIEPGTAIDCCGHEIVVRERECVDLTTLAAYNEAMKDGGTHRLQICIRYRECPSEQVPVLYDDCSCDESRCAPNRILESWEIDLLVDRPLPTRAPGTPSIAWTSTIAIAHPIAVALHDATKRLYVLNADGTIFPVRTDNHSVLAALTPPSPALALAVSADGSRLYVVVGPADRSVLVYDTANLAAGPTQTLAIAASAGSDVELVVAPATGQLVALVASSGRLLQWKTDINSPGVPAAPDDLTLVPNLRSLAVSSDGTRAWAVDPAGHQIQTATLAPVAANPPLAVPPGTVDLFAMAVVRTTAPDAIAVVSKIDGKLRLFTPGQPTVREIQLTHEPRAVVVSPDGTAAFVVERDTAKSYIETVSLFRLQQGTATALGGAFEIGRDAGTGAIAASGARLYQPWTGDTNDPGDGAVALLDVSEARCGDLLLGDCPSCEEPDCLVLATVENYDAGDRFEAQTDPASDPAADTTARVVRIDNRTGRVLLPSTQAIANALQCVIEHGGSGVAGPQGPPGAPGTNGTDGEDGADGADGLGLNPDLPKIIDIGWEHGTHLPLQKWMDRDNYQDHPKETQDRPPLITLYFNEADMRNIDRQTFQVSIHYPQMIREKIFTGLYNTANVDLYGYVLPLGPRPTPHTGETAKSAYAFVVYHEFFTNVHGLFNEFFQGANYAAPSEDLRLDDPCVRVLLKGDFVYAGPAYKEEAVLDAENIGGNVGDGTFTRPGPITGGKNPSGNLAQGGTFESWFFLTRGDGPIDRTPNLSRLNRISMLTGDPRRAPDVNESTAEELREVAGMTDAAVRRLVRARESEPFRDLDDMKTRARLNDEQVRALADLFVIG
jgi:DNA-binding beta-propeller fold protein YncE